jgi:hypothetical protein
VSQGGYRHLPRLNQGTGRFQLNRVLAEDEYPAQDQYPRQGFLPLLPRSQQPQANACHVPPSQAIILATRLLRPAMGHVPYRHSVKRSEVDCNCPLQIDPDCK